MKKLSEDTVKARAGFGKFCVKKTLREIVLFGREPVCSIDILFYGAGVHTPFTSMTLAS
jgi:hypothetical protein